MLGIIVGSRGLIYKTTNGSNWIRKTNAIVDSFKAVCGFYDKATNYVGLWAVGTNGIIVRSEDEGETWTKVNNVQITNDLFSVFFVDKNLGFTCGSGGIILKTIDGGTTWQKKTTPTINWLRGISFYDDKLGVASGNFGTILYTNDGGESWFTKDTSTQNWLRSITIKGLTHSDFVWSPSGIETSTVPIDVEFYRIRLAKKVYVGESPSDNPNQLITLNNENGSPLLNKDGQSVTISDIVLSAENPTSIIGNGYVSNPVIKMSSKPEKKVQIFCKMALESDNFRVISSYFVYTGKKGSTEDVNTAFELFDENNRVMKNSNGTNIRVINITSDAQGQVPINRTNYVTNPYIWFSESINRTLKVKYIAEQRVGWCIGSGGAVFKTEDAGSSWFNKVDNNVTIGCLDKYLKSVYMIDAQNAIIFGNNGTIMKTSNGGRGWQACVNNTHDNIYNCSFVDNQQGWGIGTLGKIVATINGGSTWNVAATLPIEHEDQKMCGIYCLVKF